MSSLRVLGLMFTAVCMYSNAAMAASFTPLGDLPGGGFSSRAYDVSADGSVVVGQSFGLAGWSAFRWTSEVFMQSVASILTAAGVDLTGGYMGLETWKLEDATGISADGNTIVGYGTNPDYKTEAWMADLSEAPNGLWKSTGSMAEPRRSHAAALLNDGKVLVVGGAPGSSTAEIYNPNTGAFSSAGAMVYSHGALPTATTLTNGRVLIVGGVDGGTSAEIYDPVSGKFTPTGSMHRAKFAHTASLLSDGRVLVTGGRSPDRSEDLAISETYDPVTGLFTLTGTLNEARAGHTATLLKNGMVLIVAGSQITGPGVGRSLASAELYDPVSGMFSFTGSVIGERVGHTSSLLSSGEVLIGGGLQLRSNIYDPVAGTFSFTGQMTTNRSSHIAVHLPSSTTCPELVLVAGGAKAVGPVVTTSAELYDPLKGIFSVTGSMNTPRQQFTATRMLDGRVLAVGGYDGSIDTSSAEIYEHECLRTTTPVDISGTVETAGGLDICAMVLGSGQYMFSCDPIGNFSLTGLPREQNGTVKRQIYADGFLPKIDILTGFSNEVVIMTRSGICPRYNVPYDAAFVPDSAGKPIDISGRVLLKNSQTPVCAIVLANGQYTFTCDGTGNYALRIPLDAKGQFKLQVYADGFAPTIQKFDEFKTTNIVRMARAAECQ